LTVSVPAAIVAHLQSYNHAGDQQQDKQQKQKGFLAHGS
jgi:hypothetical protein